ncbi:MAG: ABC transporter permease [Tannerella sp.]|jgi:ABC-type multidrug transport system permease subunit|nr:ABC transporter permease [Tannerella sp.]
MLINILKLYNKLKINQLYRLTITHFLETVREPEVLFWGMVFPVLISIGLGFAFTQQTETKFRIMTVESAVLDSFFNANNLIANDKGMTVQRLEDPVLGATVFTFLRADWRQSIIALKRGEADIIVSDSMGVIRYYFDPLNAQAQLAYGKMSAFLETGTASYSQKSEVSPLTLKGVRYIDFLIPGLIAFGIMSDILWGISYTLIERRGKKLLRRMVATPMKKSNLLISMMFVRVLMNFIDAVIIILAAWLIFDVTIQGSIGALMVIFLAGNLAFTGISVMISSRTDKTEVGNGWINAVQMPMLVLSGIFFSYHNFPEWSLGFIKLLPLTALSDGMRSIFNEGAGVVDIIIPSIALTVFGLISFSIGKKLFKWY